MKVAGISHPSRERRRQESAPGFSLKAAFLSPDHILSNSKGLAQSQHPPSAFTP